MLTSRPVILISAVSSELRSTRDLVAKTLIALGYEPKWQDIAPTETGDLRAVLRKWVDESHAVLQIVGHRYGYGAKEPDETFGQVSYTQYEALYARDKGKKVWYIILDEHHPTDCPDDEPEDLRKLQADYRIQVRDHHGFYHPSYSLDKTENIVLRLRDDLAELRAEFIESQKRQDEALAGLQEQNKLLLAAVRELPAALLVAQKANSQADKASQLICAYALLDETFHLLPGTLENELPSFAEMLLLREDTSEIDRANALFVTKQYAEAEAEALRASDRALSAAGQQINDAINALELAGQSACEQICYARAIEHYRAAAALIGEKRNIMEWARVQNQIGRALFEMGHYREQAILMESIWRACDDANVSECSVALLARNTHALALCFQGNFSKAEELHLEIIDTQTRVFGANHPDTLRSRGNLCIALYYQKKYEEAEKQGVVLVQVMEKMFGSQHRETLKHQGNLALAMNALGKHNLVVEQYNLIIKTKIQVLGPHHPSTLKSRNNLADAMNCQGRHDEAEQEYRGIIKLKTEILGMDHPSVYLSLYNLADCLDTQGRKKEALEFAHQAFNGWKLTIGSNHPDTVDAQKVIQRLEQS